MRHLSTAIALIVWLSAGVVFAAEFTDISPSDLKKRLDGGDQLILVNTLPPLLHQTKHLPGSLNIPASLVTAELPGQVPDKNAPLVFYCMGPK